VLGKLANGIADDALSTLALSFDGPVLAAPAMNPRMWSHPAVQRNVKVLTERGVGFVWPGTGPVACGDIGTGRLADVSLICQRVHESLAPACGGGRRAAAHSRRVLVTAGPTREAIDPVRFLSNRSSGRMGLAVAEAALAGGHEVTVIAGPISLPAPPGCRWIPVQTAAEMADAVKREFPQCDVLVMAAAVADYRPVRVLDQKLSKTEGPLALTLERTEDILTSVSRLRREGQVVVGFAAETAELEDRARAKLDTKRLDFVVANDVGRSDIGFGSEENEVTVLWAGGSCRLPRQSKRDLATAILDLVLNKE
jgi:phosphopantothenoylcysteine decarboxylase/phosphopantothenate--cysteine ligase